MSFLMLPPRFSAGEANKLSPNYLNNSCFLWTVGRLVMEWKV